MNIYKGYNVAYSEKTNFKIGSSAVSRKNIS